MFGEHIVYVQQKITRTIILDVKEIVKDKVVGHDRNRYGGGGGHYRYGGLGGFHSSHTSAQPFIRYWVEERYICQKCGRHISIHTRKDMR